jgi:hypothetical protein
MEYFQAAFPNWITAFDLILLKINSGNNTTIRVYNYEDIATNSPLTNPNFSRATITAAVRVCTLSFP